MCRHWLRFTNELDWTTLNSLIRINVKCLLKLLDNCQLPSRDQTVYRYARRNCCNCIPDSHLYHPQRSARRYSFQSGLSVIFFILGSLCDYYLDLYKHVQFGTPPTWGSQAAATTYIGTHWPQPYPSGLLQLVHYVAHRFTTSTGKRLAFDWRVFLLYMPFLPLKMAWTICTPCVISEQQHSFHDILFSRKQQFNCVVSTGHCYHRASLCIVAFHFLSLGQGHLLQVIMYKTQSFIWWKNASAQRKSCSWFQIIVPEIASQEQLNFHVLCLTIHTPPTDTENYNKSFASIINHSELDYE